MGRHALGAMAALVLGACTLGRSAEVAREPASPGAMSEREFQALHAPGASPARKGVELEVLGARAYLSLPSGAVAPLPAIVVVHEAGGLNGHMLHWADRLAAEGYAALAVDLLGGKVPATPEESTEAMRRLDPERADTLLRAAHAFLIKDERVRAPRTGAIGWSVGSAWALRLALAEPGLDAVVAYYGWPVLEPEVLASLRPPLLGVYGTRDVSVPPTVVDQFEQALDAAQVPHRVVRYEAEHAFANPDDPRYHAWAAAAAWQEVDAFLEKHLKR
ncbi:MAG TPA: dienelactone hydrolase family protein [Myxococcaceae bacterium]|nr:dienelactone hydrolase family protein [Myxococcaceae bacterium]